MLEPDISFLASCIIKISVAEMRMLRWMCGKTWKDRIRNTNIRDMVGIAPIEDKI